MLAGISGTAFGDAQAFSDGFRIALWICVGLLLVGGALAAALIGRPVPCALPDTVDRQPHCGIAGPAVQPEPASAH